jgi:hypothetical protein
MPATVAGEPGPPATQVVPGAAATTGAHRRTRCAASARRSDRRARACAARASGVPARSRPRRLTCGVSSRGTNRASDAGHSEPPLAGTQRSSSQRERQVARQDGDRALAARGLGVGRDDGEALEVNAPAGADEPRGDRSGSGGPRRSPRGAPADRRGAEEASVQAESRGDLDRFDEVGVLANVDALRAEPCGFDGLRERPKRTRSRAVAARRRRPVDEDPTVVANLAVVLRLAGGCGRCSAPAAQVTAARSGTGACAPRAVAPRRRAVPAGDDLADLDASTEQRPGADEHEHRER